MARMTDCFCRRWVVETDGQPARLTWCKGTTYRRFSQGHDARLKSALIKTPQDARVGVVTDQGNIDWSANGLAAARKHLGGTPLLDQIMVGIARATQARPAEVAQPAGEPTTIKVGRWTYDGTRWPDGSVTYTDKKGNTRTVQAA